MNLLRKSSLNGTGYPTDLVVVIISPGSTSNFQLLSVYYYSMFYVIPINMYWWWSQGWFKMCSLKRLSFFRSLLAVVVVSSSFSDLHVSIRVCHLRKREALSHVVRVCLRHSSHHHHHLEKRMGLWPLHRHIHSTFYTESRVSGTLEQSY